MVLPGSGGRGGIQLASMRVAPATPRRVAVTRILVFLGWLVFMAETLLVINITTQPRLNANNYEKKSSRASGPMESGVVRWMISFNGNLAKDVGSDGRS